MWTFLNNAFLSIVADPTNKTTLLVRTRISSVNDTNRHDAYSDVWDTILAY